MEYMEYADYARQAYFSLQPLFSAVNALATFLLAGGVLISIVKKPWKTARSTLTSAIEDATKEKFDLLLEYIEQADFDAIINFAQDLRAGQTKNGTQWTSIMRTCDKYEKSGKNGMGQVNINFIKSKQLEHMKGYNESYSKKGELDE